ncbi:unnamed protein product [Oncorhynchus mykiss]|uniref:Meiosis inhibitor protein 1 n=1 Tax=Oncorhynchus mykiss TaxID=8022 RepID=A0A060XA27_ONCMY|nr:unnamed protein product [Oncorhynchus mykiss]
MTSYTIKQTILVCIDFQGEMTSVDVIYENIHFRHDPKWSVRVRMGHPDQGGLMICVACVIEMMESNNVASVRKSVALSGISGILKSCPGALKELLLQDHRVCLHFTASLLELLIRVLLVMEPPLSLSVCLGSVLVQLLLELQSEQYVCYILDEIDTQLCDQSSVRGFLPTFTFLGKLVDAVPSLPQSLASSHVPLLERLCSTLLYPDESLKASVFYVWQRVWGAGGAAQSLPSPLRDRVCVLLMQTLSHACSSQLTINCLGFLKQLLKLGEVVSVLMNSPCEQIRSDLDQSLDQDQEAQSSTHLSLERCSLPLILKKTLQVASAQCMAAILVHSPSQYCASFIQADVPEFLFERLNSGSEVLLWSVYSCLLLLTEDPLFFSQCHSVYGIESLVRSLKEALRLTNVEVQRQGLLLLTEILERQPAGVRLFPSAPGFVAVAESVLSGVCSPSLQVATQAAHAATALLRVNHQSSPVQYKQLEKLVEHIIARCTELPLPASSRCRVSQSLFTFASRAGGFLLQALVCFHAACTSVRQNAIVAGPNVTLPAPGPLSTVCSHCCTWPCSMETGTWGHVDTGSVVWLLTTRHCFERCLFTAASDLHSMGGLCMCVYTLSVQNIRNTCSFHDIASPGFTWSVYHPLLMSLVKSTSISVDEGEETVPLNGYGSRCQAPWFECVKSQQFPVFVKDGPLPKGHPANLTQLWEALESTWASIPVERFQPLVELLPDSKVFSCVVTLLCSVQEQGDSALPPCVLRSALYLLSVTQDKSPDLDWAPLNCISKALSSSPSFASLYTHHPPLLHFLFRYPELAEHFGPRVLELWLSHRAQATPQSDTNSKKTGGPSEQNQDPDNTALLTLLEKSPTVILNLLGMVCTSEAPLAERAVEVLGSFLQGRRSCKAGMCTLLRPTLLQVLQRLGLESSQGTGGEEKKFEYTIIYIYIVYLYNWSGIYPHVSQIQLGKITVY